MIQRGIGVAIGGLVSLILLTIMVPNTGATWQDYIAPLVIGNIAAFFWPVVIAFWLGRRMKGRREDEINKEVQRQMDAQNKG